ncbi:alpha/beta hydrolase [Sphingobacteriales bacterium UPWRP_1]|nr:hypothetical protein BVG80_17585 [Sphingobacteriales bacterium TSM_CSM]PSJ74138.1 alpha/beta hydrolase [Sphingobacteriales bacterium UPWRP_1]
MAAQQALLPYTCAGRGSALLLLHGFCEDRFIWEHFFPALQEHFTVLTPDLPGFGQAAEVPFGSIDDMADLLYNLLKTLKISTCIVAGHSMGGYVALALAEKYPSVCNGLLLFHSTAHPDDAVKRQGRQNAMASITQYGTRPFLNQFFTNLFTAGFAQQHPQTVQILRQRAQTLPPQTLLAAMQAMMQRPNRTHVLQQVPFPVGFVAGSHDTFVPMSITLAECSLPQTAAIYMLPNAAHAAMFECPEESLNAVKDFAGFCRCLS